jgi:hypothetical protein
MRGYWVGTPQQAIPLTDSPGKPARCHCPIRYWVCMGGKKPTMARAAGHHHARAG